MADAAQPWATSPVPGTRVLVTGAAGGLGRSVLGALAAGGCRVVGLDHPGAGIGDIDGVTVVSADLRDEAGTRAAVRAAVDVMGGLDAVVGAAAVVDTIHRASTFPLDAFRADLEVNLLGQVVVAQAAFPALAESGGSIVFVASIAAQDGLIGQASYAASKAGVLGLTRALAAEWVGNGIRVNAVVPALFDTPKVAALPAGVRERIVASVPMGRLAGIAEVTGPVLYLLSPAAGYTTGQALRVDGGIGLNRTGLHR